MKSSESSSVITQAVPGRVYLFMGVVSSVYYAAINAFVPMAYEGYSISAQTVSELSAIGAPSRVLWVTLAVVYGLLTMAFGWGLIETALGNKFQKKAGIAVILYAFIGFFWPPMHQRDVLAAGGGSLTDTLHIAFTAIAGFLMLSIIWFGALASAKWFRIYSAITVVVLLGFGVITAMDVPAMEADLPTPWMGVWERISIGAYISWVCVFSIAMLKKEDNKASTIHAD